MSGRNYFASMAASPATYPYGGNYGSLYWPTTPSQTENQVGGYFDPYRLQQTAQHSVVVGTQANYATHCKYTEADSTQHSAVDQNSQTQQNHEKTSHLPTPTDPRSTVPTTHTPQTPTPHTPHTLHPSPNSHAHNSKRKATPVCDEKKDNNYFERRNRNNESAKKSRMNRKQREEQNAFRCLCLERENLQLRADVRFLEEENKKLQMRCLQFSRN